jgi:hypothetical protein
MFKGRIGRDKVGPNTNHTASRVEGTASLDLDIIASVCNATHRLSCVVLSGESCKGREFNATTLDTRGEGGTNARQRSDLFARVYLHATLNSAQFVSNLG